VQKNWRTGEVYPPGTRILHVSGAKRSHTSCDAISTGWHLGKVKVRPSETFARENLVSRGCLHEVPGSPWVSERTPQLDALPCRGTDWENNPIGRPPLAG
jgi:hypothetical protein